MQRTSQSTSRTRWALPLVYLMHLGCLSVLVSCTSSEPVTEGTKAVMSAEDGTPIAVVATTGMVADLVSNIGGDRVSVRGLMGAGVDPHLYKPTRSDIQKLNDAEIIFYNGLLLEGKLTDALVRVASSGKKVVAVTEQLDPATLLEPEGFDGHYDPHVWMDPEAWAQSIPVVRDALVALDPDSAAAYHAGAERYRAELATLSEYAKKSLESIPQTARYLVTAHDAFNYFGRRYGMQVVGIQGISTESEAGVRDIEKIVELLVERNVRAVFIESSVPRRNVQALLEGAQARGHLVKIGGELFSDAMGQPQTYEGTYVGMIDHNVTMITAALGGSVPARGLNGKLTGPSNGQPTLGTAK